MLTPCDFCLCLLSRLRFLNMKDSSPADPTFHKIGLFEIKLANARNDRAGVRKQKMKLWMLFKLRRLCTLFAEESPYEIL